MNNRLDLTIDQIYKLGSGGNEDLQAGLERVYNSTPLGPLSSNLVNTVYGINHRQTQLALPFNKDGYGLTFFTRPRLNLTTDNLRFVRQMLPLLNTEPRSIQRIIRCTLDPLLEYPETNNVRVKSISSPYVDGLNVFIPLLTNLCLTVAGWPDYMVEKFTTPAGHYREEHSMVDSSIDIRNSFELSASFRNVPNNPVTLLFFFWIYYASKVFEGELLPYGSSVFETEIDYNTRIYRLILDQNKRYVQSILSTGASFPLNAPIGALGNFDTSQPFNDANDNVNIRFECMGMEFNDPIQITEFNDSVSALNPGMAEEFRDEYYIAIPYQVLSFFNMRGYPRINPKTMELEWYITYAMFNSYATQLGEVAKFSGVRDLSFLKYISPAQSTNYKSSLLSLNTLRNDLRNGGLITPTINGTITQDELDTLAQAYVRNDNGR